MWSDAAGTKGLRAFYINQGELRGGHSTGHMAMPVHSKPGSAFSIALPLSLTHTNEHINTKELRAVEQALLFWGPKWKGRQVICHVDNRTVFDALENRTIRGASMEVPQRCLLLATNTT